MLETISRHDLREIPLKLSTPDSWANTALADPVLLLCDHAHLERKAASNALSLLHRWPDPALDPVLPERWVSELTEIARDEINHLRLVVQHILKRGGIFPKFHDNTYAAQLREVERRGQDPADLVDRLLVSALIEARSCERFFLLAEAASETDLQKLYRGLWSSEKGHFQVFLELAFEIQERGLVEKRWEEMLEEEARIISAQEPGSRIHSWI